MQDDDLASRVVDRIKDRKRITHDWKDSHVGLVGQVPDEREITKEGRQFLDAFCDRDRCSVAFMNVQENIIELRERGLRPANLHPR
jgi:hypothetical protein